MGRGIPQEIIEELRSRCDIVEIIGASVQLKRAGSHTYKGLCPFHQEKTPSFHVDASRQMYHCFGCGKGGDVFRFLMDREGMDFVDAVRMLASRAGIVIPESSDYAGGGSAREHAARRERLFEINDRYSDFFHRWLTEHPNSPAALYLRKRGIPPEIAAKFRIGAAPEYGAGRQFADSLGFSPDELVEAGVCGRDRESGRLYDNFRNRLIFTIENEYGKAVGFSARSLEAKPADGRKYINTTETPVFKKGRLLYALPHARSGISRRNLAILCEGQLDAIAFHRSGFDCAVAPLGTAFTEDQAKILKRYTNRIILAFDADAAGAKAVLRAAEILLPLSVELKVLRIAGGKDPDELFRTGGAPALADALNNTVSWLEVLGETLPEKFDLNSPVGRGAAAAQIAGYLKLLKNQVELEMYVAQAAAMLRVSEEALYAELSGARRYERRREEFHRPQPKPEPASRLSPPLRMLLELAINYAEAARQIAELLEPDELAGDTPELKALNLALAYAINDEHSDLPAALAEMLIDTPSPEVSRALVEHPQYSDISRAVTDSVAELRRIRRRERHLELLEKLRNASNDEEKAHWFREIAELNRSQPQHGDPER